jgi:hypothetical protein
LNYIHHRGINELTCRVLDIGWIDGWITIPIPDRYGGDGGAVARSTDPKSEFRYVIPEGQDNMLYAPSWGRVRESDYTFVVFGMLDAISLYQLGYPVITPTNGKTTDPELFAEIRKPMIILPDAGEELDGYKLASALGWRGKYWSMIYPPGCKDINDWLVKCPDILRSWLPLVVNYINPVGSN